MMVIYHELVTNPVPNIIKFNVLFSSKFTHQIMKYSNSLVWCGGSMVDDEYHFFGIPNFLAAHFLKSLNGKWSGCIRSHDHIDVDNCNFTSIHFVGRMSRYNFFYNCLRHLNHPFINVHLYLNKEHKK